MNMTVNFQYVGVDVSETLSAFTEEKLKKIFNKFEFVIGATVYFKKEEHQHETGKICNIELSLPGPRLFATSSERNYEVAVRASISDLERQLKKRKEVYKTH
jgi:putative sigma-54 modulation protein